MLPFTIPTCIAAKLAGTSTRTFRRRVIEPGLVRCQGRKVILASLASYLGRDIDAETFLRAERGRDAAREYQRRYRQQKRRAE